MARSVSRRAAKTVKAGKEPVMKETDVLLFTGELADLLEAGMTLGQALTRLTWQIQIKFSIYLIVISLVCIITKLLLFILLCFRTEY